MLYLHGTEERAEPYSCDAGECRSRTLYLVSYTPNGMVYRLCPACAHRALREHGGGVHVEPEEVH